MDLRELRQALRRYWWVAAPTVTLFVLLGAAAAYLPTKTYRATAIVVASPNPNATTSGASVVQTADFLIPAYIATVQSRGFSARVAAALPTAGAPGGFDLSATNDFGTGLIRISATGADPKAAADWATAAANLLVSEENARPGFLVLALLESAAVPTAAAFPQSKPILFGTLVLGLIAGFLSVLVASHVRRGRDTVAEIRDRLGTVVLGEIPRARRLSARRQTISSMLAEDEPVLLEAFQALRTNVELRLVERGPSAIAIVSWAPEEGKSTVAAGIASSLARVGHDVYVIDADLRRPTQHLLIGERFGGGLAELADPKVVPRSTPTAIRGLHLVPAGVPASHPAEALALALPRALDAFESYGSLVIVDSPPLDGLAETPLILAATRYSILVVNAPNVKLEQLDDAVVKLRESGSVLLGVVINRVRSAHSKRHAYYMGSNVREAAVQPAAAPATEATTLSEIAAEEAADEPLAGVGEHPARSGSEPAGQPPPT